MKRLLLLGAFFLITPILILTSAVYLSYLSFTKSPTVLSARQYKFYTAIPGDSSVISESVIQKDSREEILRQFFSKYGSPLEPYAGEIVDAADRYGIDWTLVPAIAMQESTLCNNLPAKYQGTFNCWGFGIYGSKVTSFSNFSEAIDSVSKTLGIQYKNLGLVTPEQIMKKYTPGSDGSWAKSVNLVMNQLQ